MTSFDAIVGHAAALETLRRLLSGGRMPHALLFHGPPGIGKATVAEAVAAALLCTAGAGSACGACDDCRLASRGAHPDLLRIVRLPKSAGRATVDDSAADPGDLSTFIVVDQIRDLNHTASFSPRQGRHRVFVIDPADAMKSEAQNALLKTLEEPPGRSVLILVASRPDLLLATVRSRCFAVGFSDLRTAELVEFLERRGIAADEAAARAALAQGRPGAALTLDLATLHARREEILQMLEALATGPAAFADLSGMATRLAGRDPSTFAEGLDLLQALLRDTARLTATGGAETLVHADLVPRLERLGRRLGADRASRLGVSVDRVRGYARINVNRQIAAETLLAAVGGAPLP